MDIKNSSKSAKTSPWNLPKENQRKHYIKQTQVTQLKINQLNITLNIVKANNQKNNNSNKQLNLKNLL